MGSHIDYIRKKYGPLRDKTLQNALAHRIGREFPRLGGARIRDLCAEMILEVVQQHLRPREHVAHGQVLWMAVGVNDPPRRHQRIADTDLVPVLLDVSTCQDIENRIQRMSTRRRLEEKVVRLCHQAHQQGGLLSNCDLAELLGADDSRIAAVVTEHERRTGQLVPRRATIHDVGSGLTHKGIICRKHYLQGKPADQVARETYHSLEAVDHYLGKYDRVRQCRQEGYGPQETAHLLSCTLSLVEEYLAIDRELESDHD